MGYTAVRRKSAIDHATGKLCVVHVKGGVYRLRELVIAARGSQVAGSRNLGPIF